MKKKRPGGRWVDLLVMIAAVVLALLLVVLVESLS
jgi:hypothetical protein